MARFMFINAKNPSELWPDRWYFGVTCRSCGETVAILEDTERGGRAFGVGEVVLGTVCPHCGADRHLYRSDEVRSSEHLAHA